MYLVSAIICCHNSALLIERALICLFDQRGIDPSEVQIIVVDNASTDNTALKAEQVGARYSRSLDIVKEPKPGLLNARLAGVAAAESDILCFVDDDNLLDDDYLKIAIEIFDANTQVGFVGGESRLPSSLNIPPEFNTEMLLAYAVGAQYDLTGVIPECSGYLWGAGLCIRTTVLKEAISSGYKFRLSGRAGASQLAGDDTEICYLAARQGWKGYYEKRLKLVHAIKEERFTLDRLMQTYEGFGRARPILTSLEIELREKTGRVDFVTLLKYTSLQRLIVYCCRYMGHSISVWRSDWHGSVKRAYYRGAMHQSAAELVRKLRI